MKKENLDYREQNAKNISKHISNKVYVIVYPEDHEEFSIEFRYISKAEYIQPKFKDGEFIPIEEQYAICDYKSIIIKKDVKENENATLYFEGSRCMTSIDIIKNKQISVDAFNQMKGLVDEFNK